MNQTRKKQQSMDMTSGSITKLLIMFAVPLVIGNLFQQLYNTVDSLVVGNFVGSHALAAVGSTTSIINMIVMFFTGTSVGAGVVIAVLPLIVLFVIFQRQFVQGIAHSGIKG